MIRFTEINIGVFLCCGVCGDALTTQTHNFNRVLSYCDKLRQVGLIVGGVGSKIFPIFFADIALVWVRDAQREVFFDHELVSST